MSPEGTVRVFKDGDMWCALIGADLQEGVAGFGHTPAHALSELGRVLATTQSPWPEA